MSPHHLSFQNFTLFLEPTLKPVLSLKNSQLSLIAFQTPTPYSFFTSLMHHHPFSCLCWTTSYNYPFPKRIPFTHKSPRPFSQKSLINYRQNFYALSPFLFLQANNKPNHQKWLLFQQPPTHLPRKSL